MNLYSAKIGKEGFDDIEKQFSGEAKDTATPNNKLDSKGKQLSEPEDPKRHTTL